MSNWCTYGHLVWKYVLTCVCKSTSCSIQTPMHRDFLGVGRVLMLSHSGFEEVCGGSWKLTWCGCKGRRSRTPLPPSVLLWAIWSGTSWECACQCGKLCGCTGPSHPAHLCRVYSPGSPPRCPHHSSLLGSFSVTSIMTSSKTSDVWIIEDLG